MRGYVRKRGDKWYYSFDVGKVNGKRKRYERVGGKTKAEAQRKLAIAMSQYNNTGKKFKTSEISVSDYLDYWLDNYVKINCKYNTLANYKRNIENHIKPELGIYKLKSLDPSTLQEFINRKYLAGFSKNHLANIKTVLSGSMRMAVQPYKFIQSNPMQYVKLPKKINKRKNTNKKKILSNAEVNNIFNRFSFGDNLYIPLVIAYHTGLRASEVCALTWDRINENKLTVDRILINKNGNWNFGPPKTKSSNRTIKIGKTLLEILKKHKEKQLEFKEHGGIYYKKYAEKKGAIIQAPGSLKFICTKQDGTLLTPNSLKYLSRVVNYELNIDFNFHALRHTHATMLIENGANIKAVQSRLGHARISTTMNTYAHVTEKMTNEVVDLLEENLPTDLKSVDKA